MPDRRVIVTGSRDWPDPVLVFVALGAQLEAARTAGEVLVVVHGDCPTGADTQASAWCRLHHETVVEEKHPADWETHKKRAGYLRNAEMAELGAARCLAFNRGQSKGTTMMICLARKAGIPVSEWTLAS